MKGLAMRKEIIMCLSMDELIVISEALDLLKNEFSVNVEINKVDIQQILDRVDNAIEKLENDQKGLF